MFDYGKRTYIMGILNVDVYKRQGVGVDFGGTYKIYYTENFYT